MNFPVLNCLYWAASAANLRHHVFTWHHSHNLKCWRTGTYLHIVRCVPTCGMLVGVTAFTSFLFSSNNKKLKMCRCNICQNQQRELKENVAAALIQMFIIDSIDLKTVEILSGRKWYTLSNTETKYFYVPLLCNTLTIINKKGSFPLNDSISSQVI